MKFPMVILALCLFSGIAMAAPGRSPAVEDFVGIEVSESDTLPQGKESLFNLEKDIRELEKVEAQAYVTAKPSNPTHSMKEQNMIEWNVVNVTAALVFFCLPLLSWYMAVSHLRKKALVESASNIEVLEKHRREREEARKRSEEYKKSA